MENASLDNWEGFISGTFLKAVNVSNEQEAFVCTKTEEFLDTREEPPTRRLKLSLESNGTKYDFDLNKTNAVFLKNNGIQAPKDIVGKKIYFNKVMAMNPQLKKEVESLRIAKVE